MINTIKSYHKTKFEYEHLLTKSSIFDDVKSVIDIKTGEVNYPITAYQDGVSALVDKYRAYVTGYQENIHYCISKKHKHKYENLTYSEFVKTINHYKDYMMDSDETKISIISYGFSVPTNIAGKDLVKMNILMHKLNYYNHDKKRKKKIELKEFEYTNHTIEVYASKNEPGLKNYLTINLILNKSLDLKKVGIVTVNDLVKKEKLKLLFDLLMMKFKELIIVDNYDKIKGKDNESLQRYLNYRYWQTLNIKNTRQTKCREKKKFHALILKHSLNKHKLYLELELKKAFNQFITN